MMAIILLIVLLGLSGLGGLGLTLVCNRRRPGRLDIPVLLAAWAPLFLSVAALALGQAGRFGLRPLLLAAGAWGLLGAGCLFLFYRRRGRLPAEAEEPGKAGVFAVYALVLLAVAGLGAVPAHRYLLGGWDPGAYVAAAAHMERTGSLDISDPVLPGLKPAEREALLYESGPPRRALHPGFLVKDEEAGLLTPDFYHLYPAWLAAWMNLFGLGGAWAGHTAIAVAALALFLAAAARLFGRRTALLGGAALAACAVQVYLMRFTTTEMMEQFALFAGFWALARALAGPGGAGYALTAGAAFGCAILAHGPAMLPVAGAGAFLGWRALSGRKAFQWGLAAAVAAGAGLALLWNAQRAGAMTLFLWDFVKARPGVLPAAAAALAAAWALGRYGSTRAGRWLPGLLALSGLAFGWGILPRLGENGDNILFLGRLLGPAGLVLAALFFAVRPPREWTDAQTAFLMAGLVSCAVLLGDMMVQPVWIWAARRWAPLVIPFLCLLAAEAVRAGLLAFRPSLSPSARTAWRAAALAGAVLWFGGLVRTAAPVYGAREYQGLPEAEAGLARLLAGADAVLCDHWEEAVPLNYVHGIPAWQVAKLPGLDGVRHARAAAGLLARWAAEGKAVYWIGGRFYDPRLTLEPAGVWSHRSLVLERRRDRLPARQVEERRQFPVWRVWPAGGGAAADAEADRRDVGWSAMGLSGFWGWETERGPDGTYFGYRRTRGKARIWLPAKAGGWRIRLNGAPGLARTPVALAAGGVQLAAFAAEAPWTVYEFMLPEGAGTNGVVGLEIRSETARRWGREIGAGVDWVEPAGSAE